MNHRDFENETDDKLTEECQFDIGRFSDMIVGYSDTIPRGTARNAQNPKTHESTK